MTTISADGDQRDDRLPALGACAAMLLVLVAFAVWTIDTPSGAIFASAAGLVVVSMLVAAVRPVRSEPSPPRVQTAQGVAVRGDQAPARADDEHRPAAPRPSAGAGAAQAATAGVQLRRGASAGAAVLWAHAATRGVRTHARLLILLALVLLVIDQARRQ